MKPYTLTVEVGPLGVEGVATYTRRDLALWYASEADRVPSISSRRGRPPALGEVACAAPVFLIAGTLTLRFDEGGTLVALDAYSNAALWERSERASHEPVARGRLRIDWHAEGDRVGLSETVRYAVSPDLRRLHIRFDPASAPSSYVEVGSGLLVAVHDGELREIVVTNLQWA